MLNANKVHATDPNPTPSPDAGASWDSLAQMGRDDPANRTAWDDLAALANQMGKIPGQPGETSPQSNEANAQANEDTQTNESNTPVNESVSQPGEAPDPLAQRRREALDYIDSVDFENADTEGQPTTKEILASIRDKTNGLWSSRDFVEVIREKAAQKFGESSTVALMCLGMPAEVVVQNQDYYNEVVNDEHFGGMLSSVSGTFSDFYHVMSATEDGINRFKKDFIESGLAKENASAIINNYIEDDSCSESELMDLAVAKSCGINLLDGTRQPHIPNDSVWRVRSLEKMDENNQTAGQRLANFLYDHDLVDGKDLHVVYSKALGENSLDTIEQGVIDVAIKRDSAVESDDPNINYWSQLSLQNGKNMIVDFLKTSRKGQIDNFDFTAEPVMRLFANSLRYGGFQYDWNNTQAQKLRKALENPVFQDIILDRIDAQMQAEEQLIARNRNNPFLRSGSFDANAFPPEGFLLLAQNHKILESMLARNAFVEHGSCKSLKTISWFIEKLEHGTVTDVDRIKLFTRGDEENGYGMFYNADDNFDSDGNLTYVGAKKFLSEGQLPNELLPFTPETYRQLLDDDQYDLLAKRGFELVREESNLEESDLEFIKFYSLISLYSPQLASLLNPDEDIEALSKCFDDSNQPTEFFAEFTIGRDIFPHFILERPDLKALASRPDVQILGGKEGTVFSEKTAEKVIDRRNIVAALTRFIRMDADDWSEATKDDLLIREAFNGQEAKELALGELRSIYEKFLKSDDKTEFPKALKTLSDFMHKNDGAGPLSQIEAFLDFAGGLSTAGEEEYDLTLAIEQKMQKDRWTNQEKSNFYAISAEVLKASPDIYHEFAELFANIPNKDDFKTFTTEIYPLYRAKLALLRDYEDHSNGIGRGYSEVNYSSVDMTELKNQLHTALLPFNLQELDPERRAAGISRVREIIFGEISGLFQTKFGILPEAIPNELTKENSRAIEDMTLYLSNLAKPTEQKKDIIGYFLSLQLGRDDLWGQLRSGVEVSPSSTLNIASAFNVSEALKKSRDNDPINTINTKIEGPERLDTFRAALQGETTSMRVGNIQSIDIKLQNLIGNIEELTDPDMYSEAIDRQRVDLLRHYPVKQIGRAAATLHQIMAGRPRGYSEGDQEIADAIVGIMKSNDIEITPENVKQYFQSGLSGIKEPFNIISNIRKDNATEAVQELQKMLTPPDDIAKIFSQLGEEFKPQSGVMALNADLDFLENLVIKGSNELSESDLKAVKEYIGSIRTKMVDLDKVYERTIQNFNKMKKSIHDNASDGVRRKIEEIDDIISDKGDQSVITSTCTNEMTTIVENMRACLSAKTKGINNDTDLTFGEGYKFYLYSNSSTNRNGSIADEIIYFVPVGEGEERRLGFVMDQVYGNKNGDILMGHVETILKKARNLKHQFPEVPISVILPTVSMSSCGVGMTAADLEQKIENRDGIAMKDIADVPVTVPESGFGDHYIEFGGYARIAGPRNVSGVEITL